MPNSRFSIKERHEHNQVDILIKYLNHKNRARFTVIDRPDPPEAIIRSNHTTRWVEVVTAYLSDEYALDLHSFANPQEDHIPSCKNTLVDFDESFAMRFVGTMKNKLEKKGYIPFRDTYGPGYLVVSIQHPLFDSNSIEAMKSHSLKADIQDLKCFRSVYITFPFRNEYKVLCWKI